MWPTPRRRGRGSRRHGSLLVAALALFLAAGCRHRHPDVILIVVDTLRADRVGSSGGPPGLTPFLDELAASGVVFRTAYSTTSWTNPAIASLFTSRYPSQHHVVRFDSRLPADEVTLAERFAAEHYRRVGVVGNFRLTEDLGFGQGFDAWFPVMIGLKPRARHITQDVVRFYDRHLAPYPWSRWTRHPLFLYLHFMDPHAPYDPPPAARAGRVGPPPPGTNEAEVVARLMNVDHWNQLSQRDVAYLASLYDAEIAGLDTQLARLFRRLRRRGLLENTIVVVTADHGEEFRDHGSLQHGTALFEESVRVPLIMAGPGLPAGRVVADEVSIVDVAPTLLALVGAAPEPRFEGRSLLPLISGQPEGRDVLLELESLGLPYDLRRHLAGLVRDRVALLVEPDGSAAAYDLRHDPHELHPNPPDLSEATPALRARLGQRRAALATRAGTAETAPVDEEMRDRLRALGYAD
jgi:arylsulfatase A-like enzyme